MQIKVTKGSFELQINPETPKEFEQVMAAIMSNGFQVQPEDEEEPKEEKPKERYEPGKQGYKILDWAFFGHVPEGNLNILDFCVKKAGLSYENEAMKRPESYRFSWLDRDNESENDELLKLVEHAAAHCGYEMHYSETFNQWYFCEPVEKRTQANKIEEKKNAPEFKPGTHGFGCCSWGKNPPAHLRARFNEKRIEAGLTYSFECRHGDLPTDTTSLFFDRDPEKEEGYAMLGLEAAAANCGWVMEYSDGFDQWIFRLPNEWNKRC